MDSYNGWRNVETWRVQLHLANDETETRTVAGIAFLYVTRFSKSPDPTGHYSATFGEWLRGYVSERSGATSVGGSTFEMFARDVVEAALARVDWEQHADHWLEAARQEVRSQMIGRARSTMVTELGGGA